MNKNEDGYVIPEKIELVTKTVGQIAVTMLVIRLVCNAFTPKIIIVEKST